VPNVSMDVQFEFTGAVVAVFGGTAGINFTIAESFASRGAKVAVVSRKQENVDAAVSALEAHGGDVLGFTADVRELPQVVEAFRRVHERWGLIDVLVSGAAGNFLAPANRLSSNGFKVVVDIDLNGTFHVMRAGYEFLAPGASVVNISAPQSDIPMRYQAHACAAKAGVDQLSRVLALEWGSVGIRVNAISPGAIADTEGLTRLAPVDDHGGVRSAGKVPLGRLGTKEDIAALAMFLSSSAATYISGAVIPVDGGGAIDGVKWALEEAGLALAGETK
jgi:NAD(P)-dependent dehydrogenase (short-subunit alcohol dehydrogenase family)